LRITGQSELGFHSNKNILVVNFVPEFMEDQPPRYSMLEAAGWPDDYWSQDGLNVNGTAKQISIIIWVNANE
jgi:hypothetical protein